MFLTVGIGLSDAELTVVAVLLIAARLFDAFNDPLMGFVVDNTRTRWGKNKPWIAVGGILSAVFFILMFLDYKDAFKISGAAYIALFYVFYVLFGMSFTVNDTAYWIILPSLTLDPKKREKLTSFTNIFAGAGLFIAVAVPPLIYAPNVLGVRNGMLLTALCFSVIFLLFQFTVLKFVKPRYNPVTSAGERFSFRRLPKILFSNDQLLAVGISFILYQAGYFLTNGFGIYYFQFVMGKYGGFEFTLFAIILGLAQLVGFLTFKFFSARFSYKKIYTISVIAMGVGYTLFMFAGVFDFFPANIFTIGGLGFVIFYFQALVYVMMALLMANTVEYGQWKNGIRTESTVYAVKTLISKLSGALQTGAISLVLVLSGLNGVLNHIKELEGLALPKDEIRNTIRGFISDSMNDAPGIGLALRISMAFIPLLMMVASYLVFYFKHTLTEDRYKQVIKELKERLDDTENKPE